MPSKYLYITEHETRTGGEDVAGQEGEAYAEQEPEYVDWYIGLCYLSKPVHEASHNIETYFDAVVGQKVWAVVVRYATGDTFGTTYGMAKILGVHDSVASTEAEKASVMDGSHDDKILWTGYFDSFESCDAYELEVMP